MVSAFWYIWPSRRSRNEVTHVDEFGVPRTKEDTASRSVQMADMSDMAFWDSFFILGYIRRYEKEDAHRNAGQKIGMLHVAFFGIIGLMWGPCRTR